VFVERHCSSGGAPALALLGHPPPSKEVSRLMLFVKSRPAIGNAFLNNAHWHRSRLPRGRSSQVPGDKSQMPTPQEAALAADFNSWPPRHWSNRLIALIMCLSD